MEALPMRPTSSCLLSPAITPFPIYDWSVSGTSCLPVSPSACSCALWILPGAFSPSKPRTNILSTWQAPAVTVVGTL